MTAEPVRVTRIFQPIEIDLPGFGEPWRGRVQLVKVPHDDAAGAAIELISEAEFRRRRDEMNEASPLTESDGS